MITAPGVDLGRLDSPCVRCFAKGPLQSDALFYFPTRELNWSCISAFLDGNWEPKENLSKIVKQP